MAGSIRTRVPLSGSVAQAALALAVFALGAGLLLRAFTVGHETPVVRPSPALPNHNGEIAFVAETRQGWFSYTVNPDGTHFAKLPLHHRLAYNAAMARWSPDGTKRALQTGSSEAGIDISVATLGTSRSRTLRLPVGLPQLSGWSPDSSQLALLAFRHHGPPYRGLQNVFVVRPDGTGLLQLTHEHRCGASIPSWSPEGRDIAFSTQCGDGGGGTFVVQANGVSLARRVSRLLTYGPPVWSPDGTRLALPVWRRGIYVVDQDGAGLHRIIEAAPTAVALSPDGSEIAFAARSGGIFLVRPDGRHLRRVASAEVLAQGLPWLSWSPDGKDIAFLRSDHRLFVMHPDGTGLRPVLGRVEFRVMAFDWQPLPRALQPSSTASS